MKLKLFCFAFMSFFSSVYADFNNIIEVPCSSSIMTIEAVDTSDETTIFLNNNTVWTCKYKDLFEGSYGWLLGDRVHITYVYAEGYYLQNASCQGCVPVKLQNANSPDLKVKTIKEIIKNDKKSTTTVVLNDTTRWFIGSWSSSWMKNWQVGDRIIITAQEFTLGNADHLLLNLDQRQTGNPENVRAQLLHSPETTKFEDLNQRQAREWEISIISTWQGNNSFIIELNNKTLLKCSQPKLDWQIGDRLGFKFENQQCKLINLRNSEEINATIINSHAEEIDLPTVQRVSKNGKQIILSDESVWFSNNNKFDKWQRGDRVIASSLSYVAFNTSTHLLVNVDKSTEGKESQDYTTATLVK